MNLEALLLAIAIVETGDAKHPFGNDDAVGKAGEVSRYQIKPSTWKQINPEIPVVHAIAWSQSRYVASNIVFDIRAKLPPHLSTNEWWIAYSWKRGINGALRDYKNNVNNRKAHDYATRVSNTYEDLMTTAETNRAKGK